MTATGKELVTVSRKNDGKIVGIEFDHDGTQNLNFATLIIASISNLKIRL